MPIESNNVDIPIAEDAAEHLAAARKSVMRLTVRVVRSSRTLLANIEKARLLNSQIVADLRKRDKSLVKVTQPGV